MRLTSTALVLYALLCSVSFAQENADYEDAFTAYELGKIDESYIFLKRSMQTTPNHLPSKMLMAEILAISGYYVDSMSEFEESIARGADLNLVVESYVRVLMILGDFGKILDIPEAQLTPMKKGFLRSAKASTYALREDYLKADELHQLAYNAAPTSINVLNSAARYYLNNENLLKAKQLLDESLAINSENSNTYALLAEYYGVIDDPAQKLIALEKGQTISASHPVILRELVMAYAQAERYADAKSVLGQTLQSSPNDPMAKLLLSWVAGQLGEAGLSKDILDELVNQLSLIDSSDLAKQDYSLFVSAMANYAANNIEIARGLFEQYVNRNPQNFDAAKLLASIYERERSFVAAANTLERFGKKVDADPSLISRLCQIYINANQNHKCNSLLERNRELHGQSPVFVQTESNLLASRGKLDLALENLSKLNSNELSVLAQQAVLAIKNDQLDIANKIVSELLVLNPENADFLNLKASIFKKQGKYFDAEETYLAILASNPGHFASSFNLTHIYYLTNRLNTAKASTLRLLAQRENDVDLLLMHANILTALKEFEGAFDSISKAEALTRNNVKVDEAFLKLHIATNELDQALSRINKLLKSDLTNVQLIRQRAGILFELGREDEAQKDLRALFGLLSDDSQSLFALSDIQGQYADLDGAISTLKRADSINPGNLFINRNLAKLALVKKDKALAQEKIEWLVTVAPNNPDVLLLQGDLALFYGNKELAATHYLNAVRINNSLALALIGAYQLTQEGIKEDKFEEVFSTLATDPDKNTFAIHLLADFYFTRNRLVQAKNAYISISGKLDYTPLPMVLNNLANIYITEDKIDAAYNFAQQAYELVQNNPSILDTLGWITVLRGQYDQGLNLLRQAFSMNAQNPDLRYHLAFALHKLGRNAESARELRVLLNDFPDFTKRNDALALEKNIQQAG